MSRKIFKEDVDLGSDPFWDSWEVSKDEKDIYEITNKDSKFINRSIYLEKASEKMNLLTNEECAVYRYDVLNQAKKIISTEYYLKTENGIKYFISQNGNEPSLWEMEKFGSGYFHSLDKKIAGAFIDVLSELNELRMRLLTGEMKIKTNIQ